MEKQLKDRSYYENIYDHGTIRILKEDEVLHKDIKDEGMLCVKKIILYFKELNRYTNRNKTIEKWIERDKKTDEFYESCKEPREVVRCKLCNKILKLEFKDLNIGYSNIKDRVLFIYKCSDCHKGRGFYDNGEEFASKIDKCKECGDIIDYKGKFKGDIFIKKYSCDSCGIKYTEEEDFSINISKEELITKKDLDKYGYTQQKAKKMFDANIALKNMSTLFEKLEEDDKNKEEKEKIKYIKKYNLFKLEELINKGLNKTDFTNFKVIKKEQIKTYMKLEFEAYYKGKYGIETNKKLDKILKKILSNSNWKIQEHKTTEKLGIINGFIFGYDTDEDLLKLIKIK